MKYTMLDKQNMGRLSGLKENSKMVKHDLTIISGNNKLGNELHNT